MKNTTHWFIVAALATSGVVGFACGGGNSDTNSPKSATVTSPSSAPSLVSASSSAVMSASVAPPAPPPPIVIFAMKLTGGSLKKPVELKDDGTVVVDGKPVAKFVGAELQDTSGKTLIAVAEDNTVTMDGSTKTMKFTYSDELLLDGGNRVSIADDGSVMLIGADHKPDKDSGKMKFNPFKSTARRVGIVIVVALAASKLWTSPPPATSAKK